MDRWVDEKMSELGKDKESKANARVSNESCRVNRKRIFFFNRVNERWRIRIFDTKNLNT